MSSYRVSQAVRTAAVSLSFLFLFAIVAFAQPGQNQPVQDRRQNEPGKFDFYVLALSWSPSFCEASAERAQERGQDRPSNRAGDPQSGGRFPSWCMGYGRNTKPAFPRSARCPRRGSTVTSSAACSI